MIIVDDSTTIQISKKMKKQLDAFKGHQRETYEDVIGRLVTIAKEDEEAELELSEETLKGLKEAEEDIKKGRVYTTAQVKKELGL